MCIRDRDEPAPDSDDFIYDWAEELHERLGDRALRAPAPVPVSYTHLTLPTSDLV